MPTYSLEPSPSTVRGDITVGDAAERGRDRLLIGQLAEAGPLRRLWLDISGEQVVAILGKRGTGKSYTLGVLLEGLASGAGQTQIANLQTPRAGLVLDIMDIYWTAQVGLSAHGPPEVVKQYNVLREAGFHPQPLAVDVWVPAGFERVEVDPPGARHLRIQACDLELDDWGSLFEVDMFNEPRGMLIAETVAHVSTEGYLRRDNSRVAANPDFGFHDMLNCLDTDVDIKANYHGETIRSIRQRLATYASLSLFTGKSTRLRDLLRPFQVTVLMLGRLPDALKKVVVAVMMRRLLRERRDASFAQKRLDLDSRLAADESARLQQLVGEAVPRTWVLLDEAHVLAGSDEPSSARDALIKLAKEGRNYGLSMAIATQQPSALDSRLMSQVETLLVHQFTSPNDAAVATKNMRSPAPTNIRVDGAEVDIATLLRRLGQGVAAFSCGNAPGLTRLCVAAIRPRISAHGGYEA